MSFDALDQSSKLAAGGSIDPRQNGILVASSQE